MRVAFEAKWSIAPSEEERLRQVELYQQTVALWTESSKRKPDPPLKQATLLIDLVPVPGLRKKLRKFVADEQQEIIELYEANRKYDMHLSC